MSALRVLLVGGTGIISSACVPVALAAGHEVTVLNRGTTALRPLPDGVEALVADARDAEAVDAALAGRDFDVVVDFVAFTPEHVRADLARFEGRVGQYVFVSSASAYQTPALRLPITESTPLRNPSWAYSRDKIACEDVLHAAYRERGFPVTIVRPSHTYDRTQVPTTCGWTDVARMRRGAPVMVPGDGTSLWTLTHHEDLARALVPLLGDPRTAGDAVHVTSDEALTWDQVYRTVAAAAGVDDPHLVPVVSRAVAALDAELGAGLLGDRANPSVFDNAKVKNLVPGWAARVPFHVGAREIVAWHDADPARQAVDDRLDALSDALTAV